MRKMESLVSSWSSSAQTLPKSYIFPPEKRPGHLTFPLDKTIPVIDLAHDHHDPTSTIEQILKASQEYGVFQVINHGVCKKLMEETMKVVEEFHAMPAKDKERECSKDPNKRSCRLYTSSENFLTEELHYWRDALVHPCHPLEEHMQYWPQNPIRYREVVAKYTVEVRKLGHKILELIIQGLGLSSGYFSGELSENPVVLINHYPPCPEPSLTLGLAKHRDPSVITVLLQGHVPGLQVSKDGQWVVVEPLPHALIVNIGYILEVITNGKLKGAEHRAVTNSSVPRTTISLFIYPSNDSIIQPAATLVDASNNPPLYRAFQYKDFRSYFISNTADAKKVHEFVNPNNKATS